jgi:CO dehydrogenase maturation factor
MQAYQSGDNTIILENKWKISDIPEAYTVKKENI